MVDGHFAMASTRGDNYHLDLDGILFLGTCTKHGSPFVALLRLWLMKQKAVV